MVALAESRKAQNAAMVSNLTKRHLTSGEKVAKKYKNAAIKKAEYRRLKAIVPSVANQKTVSKLTVIEEAIKYIDQLHSALVKKVLCSDESDKDNTLDASTILNNLQRSCVNNSLPFNNADDFIRNFILQPKHHRSQKTTIPSNRQPYVPIQHGSKKSLSDSQQPLSEKIQNTFSQQVQALPQQNATMLTTATILSTATPFPLSAASSTMLQKSSSNSWEQDSCSKVKRILF